MNQTVTSFLTSHAIGCLSISLPDGSPHGAAMHYAHTEDPFEIVMVTGKGSKKVEAITSQGDTLAAFVVGFDRAEMETIQMDGTISIASGDGLESAKVTFFKKFPDKEIQCTDTDHLFLVFKPHWWQYAKLAGTKEVIRSEE